MTTVAPRLHPDAGGDRLWSRGRGADGVCQYSTGRASHGDADHASAAGYCADKLWLACGSDDLNSGSETEAPLFDKA